MATFEDLAQRIIPDENKKTLDFILWNHTCFGVGSVLQVARHLKKWKILRDQGLSNCILCGSGYKADKIVLGGTCGECESEASSV